MTDSNIYIISEIIFKTEIEKFEETTMSLPHQNTKQGLASSLWNVEHVETEIDVHLFTSKKMIIPIVDMKTIQKVVKNIYGYL